VAEEGFTRNWPKLIEMDTETKNRVDAMWASLGINSGRGKREAGREKAEWMPVKKPLASQAGREGQTLGGQGLLLRHANLVRLPHTVFALPFALVGVVLATLVAPDYMERCRLGDRRIHDGAICGNGIQSHRRSRNRRAQSAYAFSGDSLRHDERE